jgi:hypothetical protein
MKLLTGIIVAVIATSTLLYAAPAQISATPGSLAFGTVPVGGASAEQSYLLTGNKNSAIDITAPAGFKVSRTSGGPYTSSLIVAPVGGVVNTRIYVVFEPVTAQPYSAFIDNIMQTHLVRAYVTVTGNGVGVENPVSFNAQTAISQTDIDLDWVKNANDDDCMIARTTDGIFGTPVNGTVYSVNDTVPGGGLVIYKGIDLMHTDTGLMPSTLYYYKIWSFAAAGAVDPVYSSGLEDSATTAPEPGFLGVAAAVGLLMLRKGKSVA